MGKGGAAAAANPAGSLLQTSSFSTLGILEEVIATLSSEQNGTKLRCWAHDKLHSNEIWNSNIIMRESAKHMGRPQSEMWAWIILCGPERSGPMRGAGEALSECMFDMSTAMATTSLPQTHENAKGLPWSVYGC